MDFNNQSRSFQSQGNWNGNNQPQAPRYKKSAASFTLVKQSKTGKSVGMLMVNAWVKTKAGLIKIKACGYKKRKGKNCEWQNAVCEVTNLNTGQTAKYPTLINVTTNRMKIKELSWMVTAKGGGMTRSGKRVTGSVITLRKG